MATKSVCSFFWLFFHLFAFSASAVNFNVYPELHHDHDSGKNWMERLWVSSENGNSLSCGLASLCIATECPKHRRTCSLPPQTRLRSRRQRSACPDGRLWTAGMSAAVEPCVGTAACAPAETVWKHRRWMLSAVLAWNAKHHGILLQHPSQHSL